MKSIRKLGLVYWICLFQAACSGSEGSDNRRVGSPTDSDRSVNSVSEGASTGSPVGITVVANDPDDGETIRYSITGGDGLFSIDQATGVVTVASALDAETSSSHQLIARAMSSDGTSSTISLTIEVSDENDNPPVFSNGPSIVVPEGSLNAGVLSATDADATSVLEFSITGGVDAGSIAIGSASGEMTFSEVSEVDMPLDINSDNVYEIDVSVTDGVSSVNQSLMITVEQNSPPSVSIVFPPDNTLFPDDNITARGVVSDADGDEVEVAVTIGSMTVDAEVDQDTGTWIARDIAIASAGRNTNIQASARDRISAQTANASVEIDTSAPLLDIEALFLDVSRDFVYSANRSGEVVAVDLSDGSRELVYRSAFLDDSDVAVELSTRDMFQLSDGLLVFVDGGGELFSLSRDTQAPSIISGENRGEGVELNESGFSLIDLVGTDSEAYALNRGFQAGDGRIIRVDLATGNRSLLSGSGVGEGPTLRTTEGLVINMSRSALYTIEISENALVEINISSGNRRIVSGGQTAPIGSGPLIGFVSDITLNENANKAYMSRYAANGNDGYILEIDLATGNRSILTINSELRPTDYEDIVYRSDSNTILVADPVKGAVFSFDLDSGEYSLISSYDLLDDVDFIQPRSIVNNTINGRLLVSDSDTRRGTLTEVDPVTGASVILSGRQSIGGLVGSIRDIALEPDLNRVIASNGARDLVSIDLATGEHTGFSGINFGSGAPYPNSAAGQLAIDLDAGLLYAQVSDQFFTIGLSDGFRTIFDANIFLNEDFKISNSTLFASQGLDYLVGFDLTTEQSTVLSNEDVGTGDLPRGVDSLAIAGNELVYLFSDSQITEINSQNGDRRIVAEGSIDRERVGDGPPLFRLFEGAFDSNSGLLFVADEYSHSILAIDPASGDRVIFAK